MSGPAQGGDGRLTTITTVNELARPVTISGYQIPGQRLRRSADTDGEIMWSNWIIYSLVIATAAGSAGTAVTTICSMAGSGAADTKPFPAEPGCCGIHYLASKTTALRESEGPMINLGG